MRVVLSKHNVRRGHSPRISNGLRKRRGDRRAIASVNSTSRSGFSRNARHLPPAAPRRSHPSRLESAPHGCDHGLRISAIAHARRFRPCVKPMYGVFCGQLNQLTARFRRMGEVLDQLRIDSAISINSIGSYHLGTSSNEQLPENRSMATRLIRAIAADREVGSMRESRQQIENPTIFRTCHLAAIALHESGPLAVVFSRERKFDRRRRGGQIGQPDVVPIA